MIVSGEVTAPVPEIDAGCCTEQVGELVAPDGPAEIAHVSATIPVNPPLGVMVTVELADPPCANGAGALAARAKLATDTGWMTYAALARLLVPTVGLTAIALIVSDAAAAIGLEYCVDAAVGVVPSVV